MHPDDLAKHLAAKGIIAEHTAEEAANCDTAPKSLRLLVRAIMQHGRKEGFDEFLDFVQSDVSTRWLATRIRGTIIIAITSSINIHAYRDVHTPVRE